MINIITSRYLDFLSKFGVGGAHPGGINLTKQLLKNEEITNTSCILDVGCGTGQTAAFIASMYGAKVTGADIHPIMVDKAKKRMAINQLPVEIIHGSIEHLPIQDGKFDLILSESVLAFVNRPKALKEIMRLLKAGGRFIANELTINKQLDAPCAEEIKQFYGIDSLYLESDWVALLKQCGFKNITIHRQAHPFSQNNEKPELQLSDYIEPELFTIYTQHVYILFKYREFLGQRIFSCTK